MNQRRITFTKIFFENKFDPCGAKHFKVTTTNFYQLANVTMSQLFLFAIVTSNPALPRQTKSYLIFEVIATSSSPSSRQKGEAVHA